MKKLIKVMLALACVAAAGRLAQAADNATEFGIEDDLTVLGSEGTALDPDAEIKGFTVFGRTQAAYQIPVASGNVVLNGIVQVSSGLYVAGGSTFTSGAYFTGVSSFTAGPAGLFINGGAAGQVMSYNAATGAMQWSSVSSMVSGDNLGDHIATTTLQMSNFGIVNVASITANGYVTVGASVTIAGAGGIGLGVTGTVNAADNVALSSNTVIGGAIGAVDNNERLKVVGGTGSGNYAAAFYSGASLAAWIKKK